jgi:hypothetical protein
LIHEPERKEGDNMPTEESRDIATPHGGVRLTAYYLDDKDQPAEKEQATRVRVDEFNEKGERIFTTYLLGLRGRKPPLKEQHKDHPVG